MDRGNDTGRTVLYLIDELQMQADLIMIGQSLHKPFQDRKELEEWCRDSQPIYEGDIPEVVDHFARRYGLE